MKQILTILAGVGGFTAIGYCVERFGFGEPFGYLMVAGAVFGFLVGCAVIEQPEHLKKKLEEKRKSESNHRP